MKHLVLDRVIEFCFECPCRGIDGTESPICQLLEWNENDILDFDGDFPAICPLEEITQLLSGAIPTK
jgi:hypothetical protein